MYKKALALVTLTFMLLLATGLQLSGTNIHIYLPSPISSAQILPEDQLLERAFMEASVAGLQSSDTSSETIYQTYVMNLGDWYSRVGVMFGPDAAAIGLVPDRPVFVLAIEGDVKWPHIVGQSAESACCDKMTIVIFADTGELAWSGAYEPKATMPLPAR